MDLIEWLKVVLLGIVEGITEWLPISSTGHMILVDEIFPLNVDADFMNVFEVVIQLGAILAVVVIYFWDLWPFHTKAKRKEKSYFAHPSDVPVLAKFQNFADNYFYMNKIVMWLKIAVSCLPAAVIGLAFNDWIEAHLMNYVIVALMLILYGVLFIVIENYNKTRKPKIHKIREIDWKTALLIGVFQLLSIVPGTSRSGATIIGGILLGTSRELAAEYTPDDEEYFGDSGVQVSVYPPESLEEMHQWLPLDEYYAYLEDCANCCFANRPQEEKQRVYAKLAKVKEAFRHAK